MKPFFTFLKRRCPGLIAAVVCAFIRMLYLTLRVRLVNEHIPCGFHSRNQGVIQVMWHARLGLGPFAYQGKNAHILISSHGDGEIIARITALFGFRHIRGSSSKGGGKAFRQMLLLARRNEDLVLTPDGPRGPAEVVKPGVAEIASLTGLPVIPFGLSASRAIRLRSWDRFMVPLPFSRVFFVWGEPLYCGADEDSESFRLRVEAELKAITDIADQLAVT